MALQKIPCVHYVICFKKKEVQALIDSSHEVNAMISGYASKLALRARHINVGAQKIDRSTFQTFKMVLANFQVEDKLRRAQFFQETFLLADISIKVVLDMSFLTFSNADIQFAEKELTWRFYTTIKTLLTTKRIEFIDKKKFIKVALDKFRDFCHTCSLFQPSSRNLPRQRGSNSFFAH